jgi:hypothetical protein
MQIPADGLYSSLCPQVLISRTKFQTYPWPYKTIQTFIYSIVGKRSVTHSVAPSREGKVPRFIGLGIKWGVLLASLSGRFVSGKSSSIPIGLDVVSTLMREEKFLPRFSFVNHY